MSLCMKQRFERRDSLFICLTNTFFPMKSISPSTHENFQRLTIILDAKRPQQRNLSVRLSAVKGVPLSSSRFLKHLYRTYHLTFEKKTVFHFSFISRNFICCVFVCFFSLKYLLTFVSFFANANNL